MQIFHLTLQLQWVSRWQVYSAPSSFDKRWAQVTLIICRVSLSQGLKLTGRVMFSQFSQVFQLISNNKHNYYRESVCVQLVPGSAPISIWMWSWQKLRWSAAHTCASGWTRDHSILRYFNVVVVLYKRSVVSLGLSQQEGPQCDLFPCLLCVEFACPRVWVFFFLQVHLFSLSLQQHTAKVN